MFSCILNGSQADRLVAILTPLEKELELQQGYHLTGYQFSWISLLAQEALRQYCEQFREGAPIFNTILCGFRHFGAQKNRTILELAQSVSQGLPEKDQQIVFSSIFQGRGSPSTKIKTEDQVTKDISEKDFSLLSQSFDPIFLNYITKCDAESTSFVDRAVQRGASQEEICTEMKLALIAQFLKNSALRP